MPPESSSSARAGANGSGTTTTTSPTSQIPPHLRKAIFTRLLFDFTSCAVMGLPILGLFLFGKPFKRGFFCDDESIRYPFHESTVTTPMLYLIAICIPFVAMLAVELIRFRTEKPGPISSNLFEFGFEFYAKAMPFFFGALLSQVATDIAKYSIGRPRPHFIDVCHPFYRGRNITDPDSCIKVELMYIDDFECRSNQDAHTIREASLSFMSGHSSLSAYGMVYLVIYLQKRLTWPSLSQLKPALQAIAIYLTLFTGMSRISDYKHHWSDVLVGLIQGTVSAILVTRYISDLFGRAGGSLAMCPEDGNINGNGPVTPSVRKTAKPDPRGKSYKSCNIEMNANS